MKTRYKMLIIALFALTLLAGCGKQEASVTAQRYSAVYAEFDGRELPAEQFPCDGVFAELRSDGSCTLSLGNGESTGIWAEADGRVSLKFTDRELSGTVDDGILSLSVNAADGNAVTVVFALPEKAGQLSREREKAKEPASVTCDPEMWWSGDWYGWWSLYRQEGRYKELENDWWDLCAEAFFNADGTLTMLLWDSDGSYNEPCGRVYFEIIQDEERLSPGTAVSTGGEFFANNIGPGDWTIDPTVCGYEDTIVLELANGKDGNGSYRYRFCLRPWGSLWDSLDGDPNRTILFDDVYPAHYYDWYLPLISSGEAMPDSIG